MQSKEVKVVLLGDSGIELNKVLERQVWFIVS